MIICLSITIIIFALIIKKQYNKIRDLNYLNEKMYYDNNKLVGTNQQISNEFKKLNTSFYQSKRTNELLLTEIKELSDENENLQLEVDKLKDADNIQITYR